MQKTQISLLFIATWAASAALPFITTKSKHSDEQDPRAAEIRQQILNGLDDIAQSLGPVTSEQRKKLEAELHLVEKLIDEKNNAPLNEHLNKKQFIVCKPVDHLMYSFKCNLPYFGTAKLTACSPVGYQYRPHVKQLYLCENNSTSCKTLASNFTVIVEAKPHELPSQHCLKISVKTSHHEISGRKWLRIDFTPNGNERLARSRRSIATAAKLEVVLALNNHNSAGHHVRFRRSVNSQQCDGPCCATKKELKLVEDIGLDFILYPKKLNFQTCQGTCELPGLEPISQALSKNQKPCCSPWQMQTVDVAIIVPCKDDPNQLCFTTRSIPNLKIHSCRCSAYRDSHNFNNSSETDTF